MKTLKIIFTLFLAFTSLSVFGAAPSASGTKSYKMEGLESTNPFQEAAEPEERKLRRPSSEEIYRNKYELDQGSQWQDMEEHCGDRCIYPDSNHK